MFSNFTVLSGMVVPDDAAATAHNIITNEMLFRNGLIGFVIVLLLDVLVSWALYVLLKPVNTNLAMLAAWFRLVYTATWRVILGSVASD